MIILIPNEDGIYYTVNHSNNELTHGVIKWEKWEHSILLDSNEIIIQDKKYKIGANTIETIYPKNKQKPWMDRPNEKIKNSTSLKVIDRNFKGYLNSLEAKKKEEDWIKQNL